MTKERKCPKCGLEIAENHKFCSNCGTEVPEEVEEVEKKRGRTKTPPVDVENIKSEVRASVKEEVTKEVKDEIRKELLAELKEQEDKLEKAERAKEIEEASNNSKVVIYPIISCIITLLLCLAAFGFFYNYYMKNLVIETTRTEKEVTVNEHGISDAVEKVYDATVVVESYVRDRLYATGSGFVFKTDDKYGYILTNDHVIQGASEVKVLFSNEKRVVATVVGSDSYSDVGVLKVDKEAIIAVAEIGSTEELKVGDTAFAVGAPLDSSTYAWTVTRGIISGKNRTVEVGATSSRASSVMEVLQTDAAINNGNSGGPLCNSNGEVIGITNMKLASSSIEGMGFAIPIETAVTNAEKLIKGGKVSYPYLGVYLNDIESDVGSVIIEEIEPGSPADKGGLEKGDIITKVDGKEVTSSSQLKFILYKHSVGDKIQVTVSRNGKEKIVEVTLGSNGEKA